MKKSIIFFILLIFIFILKPNSVFGETSGEDLVDWMQEHEKYARGDQFFNELKAGLYAGYIMGVSQGMATFLNIPPGVKNAQIFTVVTEYLKSNPEKWHEPAWLLVFLALAENWGLSEFGKKLIELAND